MGVTEPDSTYPLALLPLQQPCARPRRGAVPCVLLIAGSDLSIELAQTVLWRFDLVRVSCPDPRNGLGIATALAPDLIVVGALRTATTLALVRGLRRQVRSAAAIVVVARAMSASALHDLAGAGAIVWDHPVDPRRWDDLLHEILGMPTRRDLRVAVRVPVRWCRPAGPEATAGLALDLSARGMLLESRSPLAIGSRLHLAFTLPQDDLDVQVVGEVVREVPSGSALRYGVAFLAVSDQAGDRIAAFVDAERRVGSQSPESAHG